jgi:L-ribulose-5-phosphate 4-epimerase
MPSDETWQRARETVVLYGRRLQAEGLVHWTSGNVSLRVVGDAGLIAMTPTDTPYDTMQPEDVCIVRSDGSIVDGRRAPTSEFPLHTLVYQRRAEVGAIVHAHSRAAMTMAALGWTLPPILTGFVEAAGGAVTTVRYSRPGTPEMADFTADALSDRGACFLRHHGLLAIGATIERAFKAAAVTEAAADVYLRARQFGEVPELPEAEVAWIADLWRGQWATAAGTSSG